MAARELELVKVRPRPDPTLLGPEAECAQQCTDMPAVAMPRRRLNPRIAARARWVRVVLIAAERAFEAAYRLARDAWRAGEGGVFPAGTYALRRFAGVPVSTASTLPVCIVDGPPAIPIG